MRVAREAVPTCKNNVDSHQEDRQLILVAPAIIAGDVLSKPTSFADAKQRVHLRVFAFLPGITPLGNDPEWFNNNTVISGNVHKWVNTQWVYSQAVIQNPLDRAP